VAPFSVEVVEFGKKSGTKRLAVNASTPFRLLKPAFDLNAELLTRKPWGSASGSFCNILIQHLFQSRIDRKSHSLSRGSQPFLVFAGDLDAHSTILATWSQNRTSNRQSHEPRIARRVDH
jgi:hypothetical protein